MAETTKKTIVSPQTGDKYTHIHHKSGQIGRAHV